MRTPDGRHVPVTWGAAGAGYIETVGIPLVHGRSFTDAIAPGSAPVVIINETLAHRFWPGQSPIGQQINLVGMREVIGVVRDGKYRSLDESPTPYAFLPFPQVYSARMTIHARARVDEASAMRAVRDEVARLDANIALENVGRLSGQLDVYSLPQRVAAASIGAFGLVGLALAALGIYGVIAYHVATRTRELGIRLALGARGGDVVRSVLRRGIALFGVGVTIGFPLSLAVGRLARNLLYGVGSADAATFGTVTVLLCAVTLLASWLPARRAARVDPMVSLRAE
jgi:predicted permease